MLNLVSQISAQLLLVVEPANGKVAVKSCNWGKRPWMASLGSSSWGGDSWAGVAGGGGCLEHPQPSSTLQAVVDKVS